MTVEKLIEELKKLPKDTEVVVSHFDPFDESHDEPPQLDYNEITKVVYII